MATFRAVFLVFLSTLFFTSLFPQSASSQTPQTTRVLWWNGMKIYRNETYPKDRELMANYLQSYAGDSRFLVEYVRDLNPGALAGQLARGAYDVLVLDITDNTVRLNQSDLAALQSFYASGRNALMLDGSFLIRNMPVRKPVTFPGPNGSSGKLLVNQVVALARRGGGILLASDHNVFQPNSNAALNALLPGAAFTGRTRPSTDGDFIGDILLGSEVVVAAKDVLRHWEAIPNQGEAPVGQFTDFLGRPVTLYSLVETADKPGGGRKRPYISANFDPGQRRTAIDSEQVFFDNLPTHKSP